MELIFHIEGPFSPKSIPMDRLAEYMKGFAQLLGEVQSVHFDTVTEGSVALRSHVDRPAVSRVTDRIGTVGRPGAPKDVQKAFESLDDMLKRDGATATLRDANDNVIIPFPGKTRPEPLVFGPIRQDGSLVGQVVRVGGKDETIPVNLRDGNVVLTGLTANEEIARRLAQHYLAGFVRVYGNGVWHRDANGVWRLEKFRITDFEVLDDKPLDSVIEQLRAVPGSGWEGVPDPVARLLEDRRGNGETH